MLETKKKRPTHLHNPSSAMAKKTNETNLCFVRAFYFCTLYTLHRVIRNIIRLFISIGNMKICFVEIYCLSIVLYYERVKHVLNILFERGNKSERAQEAVFIKHY